MEKNKIIKLLVDMRIEFKIRNYPIELRDTTLVAKFINIPAEQLFKSLIVVDSDSLPMLVMLPSNSRLNLTTLKNELDKQGLSLADRTQVKKLTGMEVGGVSPLGLLDSDIPIYISSFVTKYSWIVFSAGQRGVTIQLSVPDMLTVTKAHILSNDY